MHNTVIQFHATGTSSRTTHGFETLDGHVVTSKPKQAAKLMETGTSLTRTYGSSFSRSDVTADAIAGNSWRVVYYPQPGIESPKKGRLKAP